jgi:hypothetical protein
MNPKKAKATTQQRQSAEQSEAMNWEEPDRVDEDVLNRVLWHAMRGAGERYPAEFAGAHGKGLKGLKLKTVEDDDDD